MIPGFNPVKFNNACTAMAGYVAQTNLRLMRIGLQVLSDLNPLLRSPKIMIAAVTPPVRKPATAVGADPDRAAMAVDVAGTAPTAGPAKGASAARVATRLPEQVVEKVSTPVVEPVVEPAAEASAPKPAKAKPAATTPAATTAAVTTPVVTTFAAPDPVATKPASVAPATGTPVPPMAQDPVSAKTRARRRGHREPSLPPDLPKGGRTN